MDYSDDWSPYKMLQHALLRAHAGMNTLHRYYVSCIGWIRVPVTCRPSTTVPRRRLPSSIARWPSYSLCSDSSHATAPYKLSFLLLSEPVSFPEQILGSGIEVSQLPFQNVEQSAVCTPSLLCLNILNPTCLMRFETEALRGSCFYGRHINLFMYVCMYVQGAQKVSHYQLVKKLC